MATNVSQQDETLHKVIEWCEQREVEGLRLANALLQKHDLLLMQWSKLKSTHITRPPNNAVPCSAIPARCLPKCRIKARMRND